MAISPTNRINVAGARGESQADILRRTGRYGVVQGDTDDQAMAKLNAAAEAEALAAKLAKDQAADLVLPQNIFVDVALTTAEAAVVDGTTFKLVETASGVADVRQRTASGSTHLYFEVTGEALASAAPGKGGDLVRHQRTGPGSVPATVSNILERLELRLEDKGGKGDNATANDAALAALLSQFSGATSSRFPGIIIRGGRNGVYLFNNPIAIANFNVVFEGDGTEFRYGGTSPFIDLGSAAYLSDLSAGYYRFEARGMRFNATNAGCTHVVRNRGYRQFDLQKCSVVGGIYGIESEGAFAHFSLDDVVLQSAIQRGVYLKSRNNLARLRGVRALGVGSGAGVGFYIESLSAENPAILLDGCDAEGCSIGYVVRGTDVASVTFLECWAESNVSESIHIYNENGTTKYGIAILGGQYDKPITIGDVGATGSLRGCFLGGGMKMTNAAVSINVAAGVSVDEEAVALTGTSTLTYANQNLQASGVASSSGLMRRYRSGTTVPATSTDGRGVEGDLRHDLGRHFLKVLSGEWRMTQHRKFGDTQIPSLPAGATPDVTGLCEVRTNNASEITVTGFLNGFPGQRLTIVGADGGKTTIGTAAAKLPGSIAVNLGDNDVVELVCRLASGGTYIWVRVGGSDNPA